MAEDLETRWLRESGHSLGVFSGWCLDLADEVGQWLRQDGVASMIIHVESMVGGDPVVAHYPAGEKRWKYHAALFSGGMVHDAWMGIALDPRAYFATVFSGQKVRAEYRGDGARGDYCETWRNGRRMSSWRL